MVINQNSTTTINVGVPTSTTVNLAHNHVDLNQLSSETQRIIAYGEQLHVMLGFVQRLMLFVALEMVRERREGVAPTGA